MITNTYARNNVEWTNSHVELFEKNSITNIAKVLVECKHLNFPTKEQFEKAEKDLEKLEKYKRRPLRKHKIELLKNK